MEVDEPTAAQALSGPPRDASVWNYCVTASKPTAVTHAVVGQFTSATDQNLVLA